MKKRDKKKRKNTQKSRRGNKPSKWIEHVQKFYKGKKEKNPNYKYSQALKEAADTYKK